MNNNLFPRVILFIICVQRDSLKKLYTMLNFSALHNCLYKHLRLSMCFLATFYMFPNCSRIVLYLENGRNALYPIIAPTSSTSSHCLKTCYFYQLDDNLFVSSAFFEYKNICKNNIANKYINKLYTIICCTAFFLSFSTSLLYTLRSSVFHNKH